jgi:two-component system, response regulator
VVYNGLCFRASGHEANLIALKEGILITTPTPIILVVEDDATDEMLTRRGLRAELPDATLWVARDGLEAVQCLASGKPLSGANRPVVPDFVLLDLKLPKLSGVEVLQKVRANSETQCVPVVMFSSSDERKGIDECYRSGANTYIQKPVDANVYHEVVRQIAAYWFRAASIPRQCEPEASPL